MRLVRDGKRSDQAVRQQLCAAVFDALRLQTAPEKRKSGSAAQALEASENESRESRTESEKVHSIRTTS